ncbi:probable helicase senataxin isoform X2 [Maniola jurtina]|uniref:probable helicase senataxin isoform X2 n=1 Tax=Maniola jurtina TaxID=191418 RepID=UPI001E68B0B1|nr:probable helicase senataxin isoform X2 [Maniola jurtina]
MAKWKLSRQTFGNDVYEFSEGEKITIGRGTNNKITLSSIVISRNHCVIDAKRDEVSITDLKSSNGIYIGSEKIPADIPHILTENDVIGFGWTDGASHKAISDDDKYVFKLEKCLPSITDRLKFQDNLLDDIEAEIASFDAIKTSPEQKVPSPVFKPKLQLKRKLNLKFESDEISKEELNIDVTKVKVYEDIISIISDSENETNVQKECAVKKIKLEPDAVIKLEDETKKSKKCENEDFQYEAFNVKQEHFGYNEEPIEINSDSDSESEHWFRKLSQSSPGKPLKNDMSEIKGDSQPQDGSYSQLDDVFEIIDDEDEEEDFLDDLISIPLEPPGNYPYNKENSDLLPKETLPVPVEKPIELENVIPNSNFITEKEKKDTPEAILKNVCTENSSTKEVELILSPVEDISSSTDHTENFIGSVSPLQQNNNKISKMAQMIEPLCKTTKRKSVSQNKDMSESKSKSHKSTTTKKHLSPKRKITNSQKEERKKKLKEIACKDKDIDETSKDLANSTNKSVVNVKITTANRGAFLTDARQATVKPIKRKYIIQSSKYESKIILVKSNTNNKNDKLIPYEIKKTRKTCEQKETEGKCHSDLHKLRVVDTDTKIPFKSLKPITESKESCLGKPVSKVEPQPPKKPKKTVRFSVSAPEVHEFEIEPGNQLKKTRSIKTSLLDGQKMHIFSLEKTTLITILRWNPHWLDEQMNISEPPPILSHKNPPMAIFHSFNSHKDYVGVFGDLLLMEIWECITQAFNRTRNQYKELQFRIESCPMEPPAQDRNIHLTNMAVIYNINSFFSISLNAIYTDKMKVLDPGEVITGRTLAYIKNELMLFEAMEYLAGSPLSRAILKPDPQQYPRIELNNKINLNSQWTMELNPSQKLAVSNSVSAALGDRPAIQMVQGPPGTGKSSVICAIVMTLFYDASGKKQQNRGKVLICATSNAAVDGLVIKLLNIRQSLPKSERFRMVRVGRLESMHKAAADVSSHRLAQRDAGRAHGDSAYPGLDEEISNLEAKINMWKTLKREAKNSERAAYCQGRVNHFQDRLMLLRNGGGPVAGERLVQAERRTIEGADIIVTTLASAHSYKMRGLKGRIALCIVDEAGQAIEPETLIPLTLDVTRLTLIGDPQQLPGYLCSQRAKKHGLGESLFSRLTSCSELWDESPVVLLDQQYRMHAAIAEYPNRAFYDGRVRSEPPPSAGLAGPPYMVLGISSGDKGQGASGANEMEAWGVARLAAALARQARARHLSLAVITPYSAHRDLLRDYLRHLHAPSEPRVEVNTVDSFQGQERDVVVVSLARSHGVGFLTDAGRMNVMLTRARQQLFVCLNPMAFVKNNQWQTLVDDARRRNLYRTLPNKFCQPASNGSVSSDDILNYIINPNSK